MLYWGHQPSGLIETIFWQVLSALIRNYQPGADGLTLISNTEYGIGNSLVNNCYKVRLRWLGAVLQYPCKIASFLVSFDYPDKNYTSLDSQRKGLYNDLNCVNVGN